MTPRRAAAPLLGALLLLATCPAFAEADAAIEARAREIGEEIRCVVCQNQNIEDSNAPLAKDMSRVLRERLTAGDSDEAAKAYLVERYGNFVLLRPPLQKDTWALWFGPLIFVGLAFLGFALFWGRRKPHAAETPPPLTEDERRRLDDISRGDETR